MTLLIESRWQARINDMVSAERRERAGCRVAEEEGLHSNIIADRDRALETSTSACVRKGHMATLCYQSP